jgi:hypothetical protein
MRYFFLFSFFIFCCWCFGGCIVSYNSGHVEDVKNCEYVLITFDDVQNVSVAMINNHIVVVKEVASVDYEVKNVSVVNYSVNVDNKQLNLTNYSVEYDNKQLNLTNYSVVYKNQTVESLKLNEKQKIVKEEDLTMLLYAVLGVGLLVLFGDKIKERLRV